MTPWATERATSSSSASVSGSRASSGMGTQLAASVGTNFVFVVDGLTEERQAQAVANQILETFSPPFQLSGSDTPIAVTASIGFAVGGRATPEEFLQDADIALYEAKAAGKQRAVGFSRSMKVAVVEHRRLELDLSDALESNQFQLVYQPVVELSTGEFTGVEALLRWVHPVRGVVMPDEFVPALESSGLIVPVGGWVLEEACRRGKAWNALGFSLDMYVNMSGRQLERNQIADDVHSALSKSGLDPGRLVLELTETTLMRDIDATSERLLLLKALGARIAIDDFGTGFSSLARLRRFPIDLLKIDQSFVSGIADTDDAAAIIKTLVGLGRALGIEILAEGIETDVQRVHLVGEGVEYGQGFLFARPMEGKELTRLLRRLRTARSDLSGTAMTVDP